MALLITPDQQHHPIMTAPFSIGSDANCNLVLVQDTIDPIHAQILKMDNVSEAGSYILEPYQDGVIMVNGQPIRDSMALKAGDEITIGDIKLSFLLDSSARVTSDDADIVDAEYEVVSSDERSGDLMVVPSQALTVAAESRQGCAYCFVTLDPEDPDEKRRLAVRDGNRVYHEVCWQKTQPDESTTSAERFMPPKPPPLPVVQLIPAPLYTGPLNNLSDKPLGISDNIVVLETTDPGSVTVRNNSDTIIQLDRHNMPLWAYVHYDSLDAGEMVKLLSPGKSLTLKIFPHVIRPGLQTIELKLGQTGRVNLESVSGGVAIKVLLLGLYLLLLGQALTLPGLPNLSTDQVRQLQVMLWPLLILMGFYGIIFLLAPAHTLMLIYDALKRVENSPIGSILGELTRLARKTILEQFDPESLGAAMAGWAMPLSMVMLGIAALIAVVVLMLLVLLKAIFSGFIGTLIILVVLGLNLFLLYRFGLGYDFDLLAFGRRIVRLSRSAYETATR